MQASTARKERLLARLAKARRLNRRSRLRFEAAKGLKGVKIKYAADAAAPGEQTNLYYFTTDRWHVKVLAHAKLAGKESDQALDAFVQALAVEYAGHEPWHSLSIKMRPAVIVVSLGMLAACGGLAYTHSSRDEPETATSTATTQSSRTDSFLGAVPAQASTPASNANSASAAATAASSSSSVSATSGGLRALSGPTPSSNGSRTRRDNDPKIRAAAIAKLANAPKEQALPVLKDVLETGEPEVDRHIALNSLHTIALRDGDKTGQVRDVMRRAIYHSDNDGVMQTAQSLLDDVEAALAEQQPKN